jgi:hypothetical protein
LRAQANYSKNPMPQQTATGWEVWLRARTAILLAAGLVAIPAVQAAPAPEWTALFNGRDLSNFDIAYSSKPVDGRPAAAMFEVKAGMVHTYPGQQAGTPQPSAYFQTRRAYGDYVLHLQYRWGDRKFAPRMDRLKDAGIVFHIHEDVPFSWPHGIECQIEDSDVGDLWLISARADATVRPNRHQHEPDPLQDNAAYYAPGGVKTTLGGQGEYVRLRHAADFEHPGWNSVDVVVRGDSAVYLVNGRVNMRITGMRKWDAASGNWERLDRGKILFQAEFAEVYYRDIRIRPVMESDPR